VALLGVAPNGTERHVVAASMLKGVARGFAPNVTLFGNRPSVKVDLMYGGWK